MEKAKISAARRAFARFPELKLAYLFGSRAADEAGPLSDYDFACYAEEKNPAKIAGLALALTAALGRALGTDAVDVVMLNTAKSPELKYNAVRYGVLVFEREPYRVLVEPRILDEYFDFRDSLRRHRLTQA